MAAQAQCDCGYVVRGTTRLTVVDELRDHILARHQSGVHLRLLPTEREESPAIPAESAY